MIITKNTIALLNVVKLKRNTIPILGAFLLRDKAIQATDLDNLISIPLDTEGQGVYHDILEGEYTMAADSALEGNGYKMPSQYPADEFPIMGGLNDAKQFNIDTGDLRDAITRVSACMSNEETRYYLNGIYYDKGFFVATDGHRLARYQSQADYKGEGFIIHKKTVAILERILKNCGGVVNIAVNVAKISFKFENGIFLMAKLVDGTYPDYLRVIPETEAMTEKLSYTFDRKDIEAAIKTVNKIGVDKTRRFIFTQQGEVMIENTLNKSQFKIKVTNDNQSDVGFNGRYFKEFLEAMPKSIREFKLELENPNSPARCDIEGTTFILMPMRA